MCNGCDEIINVGSQGFNGWTPVLGLYEGTCDGDPVTVLQIISFTGGSGTKPDYLGNIMTDQWLIDHPIYLGSAGLVTDICEAVNLQPSNGTNGTNGTNGEQGPPGEDGCDPDITITANVVGDKTSPLEVISDTTNPCAPSYEINFPEEIFTSTTVVEAVTGSETFTTAVENAIDGVLNVTPDSDTSLSISTAPGTADIIYISNALSIFDTAPILNVPVSPNSWINSYIIGNQMTVDFRIIVEVISGSGNIELYFKIPQGKTVKTGFTYTNTVGYNKTGSTWTSFPGYPIVTTASAYSGYLRLNGITNNGNWGISGTTSQTHIFTGQLTFLIN